MSDPTPEHPSLDLPVPASALVIVAHPDDAEFSAGATLAKWARQGCAVHHLVLTDGSKGTWDPSADIAALVQQRRDVQLEAARRLGGSGVVFGELTDGELVAGVDERSLVCATIRRLRPSVVLGHDPWKRYRLHPDHRNAGWLALDGLVAARDPHFFPHHDVGLHRPDTVLLFEAEEPDHVEDVSGFVDTKVRALMAHRSQFVTTHAIPDDDDGTAAEAFRQRVLARAAQVGVAAGVPAGEAFKALTEL